MAARALTALDLFDLCVADGARNASFLHGIHGGKPTSLRQDFAFTGATARAWTSMVRGGTAVAVDPDAEALSRVKGVPRLRAVARAPSSVPARADVTAALLFSLGSFHARKDLDAYLASTRRRLNPRGIFAADLYGGTRAFQQGQYVHAVAGPSGEKVTYVFEQRGGNAVTGRTEVALSFDVKPKGRGRVVHHRDAFAFSWRLWSLPELHDACLAAGFGSVEVLEKIPPEDDEDGASTPLRLRRVTPGMDMSDNWVAYLVART